MGSIHCSTCCECSISGAQARPTESPTAAAGDDDERENTTPDNQHLLDVTDSPPSSARLTPSLRAHRHGKPIQVHVVVATKPLLREAPGVCASVSTGRGCG